jgi:hypothetical protein
MNSASVFRSFWMGGFESASHINRQGQRLDMAAAADHDRQIAHDYELLTSLGFSVAREGVPWPQIDHGGAFDFSRMVRMARAASDVGMQVNWNLCHYGWPDDVDVFSPQFVSRFERYARAAAELLAGEAPEPLIFTLVNEISFLAWAAGEVGGFIHPHARGRGDELKRQLVRATIAGIEAIRGVSRTARFLHVDPLIHVVPHPDRPEDASAAQAYTESQFEAWDLLAGLREPEIGGRLDYLDLQGINYYHANQWEYGGGRIRWEDEPRDARWVPLHLLLSRVWSRYQRPIVVAETSHFGDGRARWILEVAEQVALGLEAGLPIHGVCLYPIIDRPDWEDPSHWHNSGLWDLVQDGTNGLRRQLNHQYAAALRRAQEHVQRGLDNAGRAD